MKFESLTNELLLNIFEYLNINELQLFYNQNFRFNNLILNYLQNHNILFQFESKQFFDKICRQHLPLLMNNIKSIYLSNNNNTPQQIDYFFTYGLTFNQFSHLQTLSLHHINSQNIIKILIKQLSYLPMLTYLNLNKCYFQDNSKELINLIENIWKLPKLNTFNINIISEYILRFPIPKIISSTLKHLSISGAYYEAERIHRLFENTPYLQSLSVQIILTESNEYLLKNITSINKLNINFNSINENNILNFLKKFPNLYYLKLKLTNIFINGEKWEKFIRNNLYKLNNFQFKIEDEFFDNYNIEKQIDKLLYSFQNHFWIIEHQWFVQCDLIQTNNYYFYTLPYAFNDFNQLPILSKSTYPIELNNTSLYNHVHTFTCTSSFDNNSTISHIRFNKLNQLNIKFPINKLFWSIIPDLNRLKFLNINWYDGRENYQRQLQTILDQSPNLYSLNFLNSPSSSSQMISFRYKSKSIRQLGLQPLGSWYNQQDCAILRSSSLGNQCESLIIRVENRACIFNIIYTMSNLRSINVRCRDDKWNEQLPLLNDELICWLEMYLPNSCTITRDQYSLSRNIHIWIR